MSAKRGPRWIALLLLLPAAGGFALAYGLWRRGEAFSVRLAAAREEVSRLDSALASLYPARIERDELARRLAAREEELRRREAELRAARKELAGVRAERDEHLEARLLLSRRLEDALSALAVATRSDRE